MVEPITKKEHKVKLVEIGLISDCNFSIKLKITNQSCDKMKILWQLRFFPENIHQSKNVLLWCLC